MGQISITCLLIRCSEENTTSLLQYSCRRCTTWSCSWGHIRQTKNEGTLPSHWPAMFNSINTVKVKEAKELVQTEIKQMWQLNATCGSRLDPLTIETLLGQLEKLERGLRIRWQYCITVNSDLMVVAWLCREHPMYRKWTLEYSGEWAIGLSTLKWLRKKSASYTCTFAVKFEMVSEQKSWHRIRSVEHALKDTPELPSFVRRELVPNVKEKLLFCCLPFILLRYFML